MKIRNKKIMGLALGVTMLASASLGGVVNAETIGITDDGTPTGKIIRTKESMISGLEADIKEHTKNNTCPNYLAEAKRVVELYRNANSTEEMNKIFDSATKLNDLFNKCEYFNEDKGEGTTESNTTTTTETNTVVEENKETTPKVEVVEEKTEAVPYEEVKEESPKADKKVETKKVEGKKKEAKKLPKTGSQVIGTIPVLVSSALAGIGILGTAGFIANKNRKNK